MKWWSTVWKRKRHGCFESSPYLDDPLSFFKGLNYFPPQNWLYYFISPKEKREWKIGVKNRSHLMPHHHDRLNRSRIVHSFPFDRVCVYREGKKPQPLDAIMLMDFSFPYDNTVRIPASEAMPAERNTASQKWPRHVCWLRYRLRATRSRTLLPQRPRTPPTREPLSSCPSGDY